MGIATSSPRSVGRIVKGWCFFAACVAAALTLAACSGNSPGAPSVANGTANGGSSTTTTASRPIGSTDPHRDGTTTTSLQAATTTTPHVTTTTARGVPQPVGTAQLSYGPAKGEVTVTSIGNVKIEAAGNLGFTLSVRNAGTLPYNCAALKAQARTASSETAIVGPLTGASGVPCTGSEDTLASGSSETFAFLIQLVGGAPRKVIALPFGSYASKVVWSVSGA
jgi:hypothetical protein